MTDTIQLISDARADEIFEAYWSLWPNRNQVGPDLGILKQKVYRAHGSKQLLQADLDERIMQIAKDRGVSLFRVDLSRYRAWRSAR